MLIKHITIYNYTIKSSDNKQSFCELIYSLNSVKQEILNTNLKINLIIQFRKFFKVFLNVLTFVVCKLNNNF